MMPLASSASTWSLLPSALLRVVGFLYLHDADVARLARLDGETLHQKPGEPDVLTRVLAQDFGVAFQGVGNLLFFLVERSPLGAVQTPGPGVVYLFQSAFGFYLLVFHEITSRIRTPSIPRNRTASPAAAGALPRPAEVLDHLLPHPIVVIAAGAPETEQVSGMVGCEGRKPELRVQQVAALGFNGKRLFDQGLGRSAAEEHEGFGFDEAKFFAQDLHPFPDLTRPGRSILGASPTLLGRTGLDDVGDVDLGPVDARLFEELVEQLAGPADERASLLDLVLARGLSYDGEPRVKRTFAEDRVLAEPLGRSLFELPPFCSLPGHTRHLPLPGNLNVAVGMQGNSRRSVRRL